MSLRFKIGPWDHQLKAIYRAIELEQFGFFFEQGTGKTCALINTLRAKYKKHGKIMRTLILCPRIVIPNWPKEIQMHSNIKSDEVAVFTGPGSKRVKQINKYYWDKIGKPHIYITNYEALLMPEFFEKLKRWDPQVLVLDESHKCKDIKAKRTKRAVELSKTAKYRYLLSGTPAPNSPMDIFSQFLILDGGERFGSSFYRFRAKFFFDANAHMPKTNYFPDWRIAPEKVAYMNKAIAEISMRVKKKDCLDLPPLVRQRIEVELGGEQKRAYDAMKREFVAYCEDGACVATLAITKALRLQQILSGHLPIETVDENNATDTVIKEFTKNPRAEALEELLAELTPKHKVIVWAVFRYDYSVIRKICEKLKVKYVEVHGGVKDVEKDKNVDEFNNNDECRVFIGNPLSGGIGINLVVSDISIFYSRSFNLEADLQAEARNYRGGSDRHHKVTRIDLVAPGTLDDKILAALTAKEKMSERLLKDLAKEL